MSTVLPCGVTVVNIEGPEETPEHLLREREALFAKLIARQLLADLRAKSGDTASMPKADQESKIRRRSC